MPDSDPVEFSFDGRPIRAAAGQTVGGALHAAGQHVLSRSFKYHRPRGLFCVSGRCPNCLCAVDGAPNVRICTLPARPGMVVHSQNRWPALGFDVLGLFDRLHRFMPVGFYYKMMYRPRWLWPWWEKIIRRIAGLGPVDVAHGADAEYDKQNIHTDVAVVGGGLAGLHAAWEAAEAGAQVVLIDEQPALGGHMRHDPDLRPNDVEELIARVVADPRIQVIDSAVAFGAYEDLYLGIQRGNRMIRVRARQIVVATGGWERPLVFAHNDRPGNLLASGAQRLLQLDHCSLPGEAVVVTDNAQGYRVANQMQAAGTQVAAIVDIRAKPPETESAGQHAGEHAGHASHGLEFQGIMVLPGRTVLAAEGGQHVSAAVIGGLGGAVDRTIPCQWIVQAVGFTPATGLLYQAGCKLTHDDVLDHAVIRQYAPGVHSAGAVNGTHDARAVALEGRRAGIAAAASLTPDNVALAEKLRHAEQELQSIVRPTEKAPALYVAPSSEKKKFVCLCEDVTEKDVYDAIDEGYANIETLKRYSTVSMGPCQGKMCQAASVAICARHNGVDIEQTGAPTSRPPEQPVPLGVLAGRAVHFSVTRRTPLHAWHEQHGARFMDAGAWKRPERYTSPEQEYRLVRAGVGLIDVSTLGKLELRGRDVATYLETLYPNRFSDLKVGRTRYGVVCDPAGIILDDGTISRLDAQRFFLTTTTGNADAMDMWFRWHLATRPGLDVRLANVSGSYAAMNLAGPRSRDVLARLTAADVSAAALPYLAVGRFDVAGVPALVFRIGFVGELGYEIHVPTQYALHVWEQIIEAGQPEGIAPFGVEAQRRLRLDKKHILVSIDTDALSNPLEADLGWIVKLDKPDFIGRRALALAQAEGPRNRLVGFRMHGDAVPAEASLVLRDGRLAGRVTSARFSQAAGAPVGLAWVPVDLATDGAALTISVDGVLHTATVQDAPFYDPKGEKLRS
jgi:sarcosine oxidase subunit alpha